jgi:hypothetical protein
MLVCRMTESLDQGTNVMLQELVVLWGTFKYGSIRVSLYECKKFPSQRPFDYHAQ